MTGRMRSGQILDVFEGEANSVRGEYKSFGLIINKGGAALNLERGRERRERRGKEEGLGEEGRRQKRS